MMIYGIGINDSAYSVTRTENGKQVYQCPIYNRWKKVIQRCYSKAYHKQHPTYESCTVCKEWLSFSAFRRWIWTQGNTEGKELDKDILFPGNKEYSPNTCMFVLQEINKLVIASDASRGEHPQGVSFEESRGKYTASMNIRNRMQKIGRYNTPLEASLAYNREKAAHITSVAREQQDPRLRAGLMLHAIDRYYAAV